MPGYRLQKRCRGKFRALQEWEIPAHCTAVQIAFEATISVDSERRKYSRYGAKKERMNTRNFTSTLRYTDTTTDDRSCKLLSDGGGH